MLSARGGRPLRDRASGWLAEHALVDLVPIAAVVVVGSVAIGLGGGNARAYTHLVLLGLTLVESAIALCFRRRHPLGALVGVLAVYTIFQLPPTMVLPVLLALLTVVVLRPGHVLVLAALGTAAVVIGRPYVNGEAVDVLGQQVPLLLAIGATVSLGIHLRLRRLRLRRARRGGSGRRSPAAASDGGREPGGVTPGR